VLLLGDGGRRAVVRPAGKQALIEWNSASAEVQERFPEILGPDTELVHDLLRRLSSGLRADTSARDNADNLR
jgi:hypothetical protein